MLRRRRRTLLVAVLVLAVGVGIVLAVRPSDKAKPVPTVAAAITGTSGGRALSGDYSGFSMGGSAGNMSESGFAPALKSLQPQSLRGYPGGIGSNYINWSTGQSFTKSGTGLSYIGPGLPENPEKLSLFAAAVKATDATPVFTLNVMTYCPSDPANPASTDEAAANCSRAEACGPNPSAYVTSCTNTDLTWGLAFQLRLLETAKQEGMPIKYVELGNELYSADAEYYFPTVDTYVAKANVWIAAIKAQFPDVQIGVVGYAATNCVSHPHIRPNIQERNSSWNPAVIAGVRDANAVVFHTYYESGIASPGSVTDPASVAHMLSTAAQSCIAAVRKQSLSQLPDGLNAWITEWNLFPTEGVLEHGSWAQGLTEGLYAIELTRQPQVALIENEMLISSQVFGAILGGGIADTAAKRDVRTPDAGSAEPFALSGGGQALSAFNRSVQGARASSAISFSKSVHIDGTKAPGLYGQVFSSDKSRNLFFVNLTGKNVALQLGPLAGHYAVETRSTAPDTFVLRSNSIDSGSRTATDHVVLPAYSVASLTSS